ncbi:peroxisomal membrane protein 11C isoform X2 [Paroedura picta]
MGGALAWKDPAQAPVGSSLLAVSEQLSHCRTVLRLFDDLAMLTYSCQYGLGAQEDDVPVRWLSVLNNLADQLYYPCEHVAWAADTRIIRANSQQWWALSMALWGTSLILGIARSLRILAQLRRKLQTQPSGSLQTSPEALRAQAKAEALMILSNTADLANAIHWLPPGLLWAGKFPPWLVGLMGTVSSLAGLYQTCMKGSTGTV